MEPYDYTKELYWDYDDRVIGIHLRNKSRVMSALKLPVGMEPRCYRTAVLDL
jgi:hypothetical protein